MQRNTVYTQVLVWGLNPVARWKYRHIPSAPPDLFFGHLMQVLPRTRGCSFCSKQTLVPQPSNGTQRKLMAWTPQFLKQGLKQGLEEMAYASCSHHAM